MRKPKYILIFLPIILAVLMTGCIEEIEGGYATYTNDNLGVSIQYPATWAIQEHNSVVTFSSALGPIIVLQTTTNTGQGLDIAVESLKAAYSTMPDYQNIYDNQATLAGLPAREFESLATQDDIPIKAVTIVAEGTHFYAITYAAPTPLYGSYKWAYDNAKNTFTIS